MSAGKLEGFGLDALTRALAELRARINALPDTEVRLVDVRSGISTSDEGTHAFAALRQALSDVPPERFVEVAETEKASVVGLSALLTTTMTGMKDVIDLIEIKSPFTTTLLP